MIKSEIFNTDVTYEDIKLRLQRSAEYKRKMLKMMVKQYMAAENTEIASYKLARWRELIELERGELEALTGQLEKLN